MSANGRGQVKVEVNGRAYAIACEPGEERRIRELGGYLDAVVRGLAARAGTGAAAVGDSHLLVMAGLTIADELSETCEKLEACAAAPDGNGAAARNAEAALALDRMAARLETIAANLERL